MNLKIMQYAAADVASRKERLCAGSGLTHRRRLLSSLVIFLVFLMAAPHALNADIIYLRNGRRVLGKITAQTRRTVKILVRGRTRTYSKRRIRRIKYETLVDVARREAADKKKREDASRRAAARRAAEEKRKEEARKAAEEERKREEAEKKRKEAARLAALKRKQEAAARKAAARRGAVKKTEKKKVEKRAVKKIPREKPQLVHALWKSALLPGWGQDYQGRAKVSRYYTANFFVLAMLARGIATTHTAREAAAEASLATFFLTAGGIEAIGITSTSTTGQLLTLTSLQSSTTAQKRADDLDGNLSAVSGLLVALYLWNVVDVFLFHPGGSSLDQLLGKKKVHSEYRITVAPDRVAAGNVIRPGEMHHRMEAGIHFSF